MSEEKPPLLYSVVYPKDFVEKIKRTGKYDVLDLARKGMVLCFDIILPEEKIDEGLKQVASMFHRPEYEHGVILCDIDEWVENANSAFRFVKETRRLGDLPLRIFETTQHLTDLFSKEKIKELDEKEEKREQRPTGGYIAKPVQLVNEEAKRRGVEHWLLFVSTHDYLVEGYFLDTLLDIHKEQALKMTDRLEKQIKKPKRKTKSQKKKNQIPKKEKEIHTRHSNK